MTLSALLASCDWLQAHRLDSSRRCYLVAACQAGHDHKAAAGGSSPINWSLGLAVKACHDTWNPGQAGEADAEEDQQEQSAWGQVGAFAATGLQPEQTVSDGAGKYRVCSKILEQHTSGATSSYPSRVWLGPGGTFGARIGMLW